MRFITEFKVDELECDLPGHPSASYRREGCNNKLGNLIGDCFKWETPVNGDKLRHRLEIEAFPMDKWIEFEKRFYDALPDYDAASRIRLINALTALMTFTGKPSGDTITNR